MENKKRPRTWDKSPEAVAYRNQYAAEHYDRVMLALPAGFRDRLDKAAGDAGISRTALIVRAIEKYLGNE
jgi:BarA-like signal transduction histidine kinase